MMYLVVPTSISKRIHFAEFSVPPEMNGFYKKSPQKDYLKNLTCFSSTRKEPVKCPKNSLQINMREIDFQDKIFDYVLQELIYDYNDNKQGLTIFTSPHPYNGYEKNDKLCFHDDYVYGNVVFRMSEKYYKKMFKTIQSRFYNRIDVELYKYFETYQYYSTNYKHNENKYYYIDENYHTNNVVNLS